MTKDDVINGALTLVKSLPVCKPLTDEITKVMSEIAKATKTSEVRLLVDKALDISCESKLLPRLMTMADLDSLPNTKREVWVGPFSKSHYGKVEFTAWDAVLYERGHAVEAFTELRNAAPRGTKKALLPWISASKKARTFTELAALRTTWMKLKG